MNLTELLNSQWEAARKALQQAETDMKAAKLNYLIAKQLLKDIEKKIEKIQSK